MHDADVYVRFTRSAISSDYSRGLLRSFNSRIHSRRSLGPHLPR